MAQCGECGFCPFGKAQDNFQNAEIAVLGAKERLGEKNNRKNRASTRPPKTNSLGIDSNRRVSSTASAAEGQPTRGVGSWGL